MPRSLTVDQKRINVATSEQNLAYLAYLATMNETWINQYISESREGLKQWVKPGESAPKRPKAQQSAGKVMASVFWDAHGVIFINYLEKEGRLLEHIIFHYWVDWLTKSG